MKMRLGLAFVALALALPLSAAYNPPNSSGEGVVSTGDPDSLQDPPPYVCPALDDLNVVDRTCSENDACAGAEPWPPSASGTSTGKVGGPHDLADWSKVEMYRTELLMPTVTSGFTVEQGGQTCTPSALPALYATENGWYSMRVSGGPHAPYTLLYDIFANDANSGKDVPNTVGEAWFINAMPKSLDPTHSAVIYTGSLPYRETMDADWYRIGSTLAAASDPTQTQGPAVGLLTVEVNLDCNGGTYLFGFYATDGTTAVGSEWEGCGQKAKSCITAGVLPVHARMAVNGIKGTAYDFTAELVPLYLVDLSDGIPRPYLDPREPWCDPLVQTVLENIPEGSPDKEMGLVNPEGLVVASFPAR